MKGPFYSVGPIVNASIRASDITAFIEVFKDRLVLAGWTVIDSFVGHSGTPGYTLLSYPTPINLNVIRIRIFFNGDVLVYPFVLIYISDGLGSSEQLIGTISISSDKGLKTLRLICGPHQFFLFIDPTIAPNENYVGSFDRNSCMGGCPKVANLIHSPVFWGIGQVGTDRTFRKGLLGSANTSDLFAFCINGKVPLTDSSDGDSSNVTPQLLSERSSELNKPTAHWSGRFPVIEPYLIFGRSPGHVYAVYLWDAIVVGGNFIVKTTSTADNHLWENITIDGGIGTLFVVTNSLLLQTVGGFSY